MFNKLLTYLKIHEKLSDWNNTTIASILSLLIFVKNENAHCTHSYTMLYAVHLQAIAMQNLILQNRKEIELYAMKMAAKESHRSGCGWNTHTQTHKERRKRKADGEAKWEKSDGIHTPNIRVKFYFLHNVDLFLSQCRMLKGKITLYFFVAERQEPTTNNFFHFE